MLHLTIMLVAILHTITDTLPIAASATITHPFVCDTSATHTIQFVWAGQGDAPVDRLTTIAQQVNGLFWRDSDSDTEARLPAWRVDDDCNLSVIVGQVDTLPLENNTKYIFVEDTTHYCGMAIIWPDDRPGAENLHNGTSIMWVATHCLHPQVVAHELLHSFGAIQPSAPHSDGAFHGTEFDIMARGHINRCGIHDKIDCGNDDYFSLQPTGYLAERWNTADSLFLRTVQRPEPEPVYYALIPLMAGDGSLTDY